LLSSISVMDSLICLTNGDAGRSLL